MNRTDAADQLAAALRGVELVNPIVLAIPRGGVVVGAVLARALEADLDVVLARKLRAPWQPELAVGAVSEDGQMIVDESVAQLAGATRSYLEQECRDQRALIEERSRVLRAVRPRAPLRGRSVIVTDDGIATGSTLRLALREARAHRPHELIAAVPVGPPESIEALRDDCDRVICLVQPVQFWAVGAAYESFEQVDDARVLELLKEFAPEAAATSGPDRPLPPGDA